MIRIEKIATRKATITWDTGMEFQYLNKLYELIQHRNEIIKRYKK